MTATSDGDQQPVRDQLRWWVGGLALAASLVHGGVAPEHGNEWWGYGVFFGLAAVGQGLFGIAVLMQPWRYDETGGFDPEHGEQWARRVYLGGAIGTAAIILLYLITRTVGVPFFGPAAGETESFTVLSLISKAIELAMLACLLGLLRQPSAPDLRPTSG